MAGESGSASGNAKLLIGGVVGAAVAAVIMFAMRPEPPPPPPPPSADAAKAEPPVAAKDAEAPPAEPEAEAPDAGEAPAALPKQATDALPTAPEVGEDPPMRHGPVWVPKTEKEARELLAQVIKASGGADAVASAGEAVWGLHLSRYDMPQVWKLRVAGAVVEAKSPRERWRVVGDGKRCVRTFDDVGGDCGGDEALRLRHVATARDAILVAPLLEAPWRYVSVDAQDELLAFRFERAARAGGLQLDLFVDSERMVVVGFAAHDQKRGFSGLVGTRARLGAAWLPTQWRMRVIENAEADPDAEKVPGPVGGDGKVPLPPEGRPPREPDMPIGTKIERHEFVVSLTAVEPAAGPAPTIDAPKSASAVSAAERGPERVLAGEPGAAAKALAAMKPLFAHPAVDLATVRVYFERHAVGFRVLASVGPDARATGAIAVAGGPVARKTVFIKVSELGGALDQVAAEAKAAGMTPAQDRRAIARMLTMPVDWESGESSAQAVFQLDVPIAKN